MQSPNTARVVRRIEKAARRRMYDLNVLNKGAKDTNGNRLHFASGRRNHQAFA